MEGGRVFLRHLSEVATVLGNMMTNEEDLLLKMKRSPAPRPKATVHDQRPTKAIEAAKPTQPQQAIELSWSRPQLWYRPALISVKRLSGGGSVSP